jgi:hypothetical protein
LGPDTDGIVFVDNSSSFREAVKREGVPEYFVDMFGGDFGHCTRKGNMLLATNVANAILGEVLRNNPLVPHDVQQAGETRRP